MALKSCILQHLQQTIANYKNILVLHKMSYLGCVMPRTAALNAFTHFVAISTLSALKCTVLNFGSR